MGVTAGTPPAAGAALVVAARAVPATATLALLAEGEVAARDVAAVTLAGTATQPTLDAPPASARTVVVLGGAAPPTPAVLAEVSRVLAPGGVLVATGGGDAGALHKGAVLGGFTALAPVTFAGEPAVRAIKPTYVAGASFSLRARGAAPPPPTHFSPTAAALFGPGGDDEELVDEDSLLTEDDLKRPAPAAGADCGPGGGKKACKNCTCGRAEGAMKVDADDADALNDARGGGAAKAQESACGNCYLGDAYRCASCPHLGKPAFKPGEKVTLNLTDDI